MPRPMFAGGFIGALAGRPGADGGKTNLGAAIKGKGGGGGTVGIGILRLRFPISGTQL